MYENAKVKLIIFLAVIFFLISINNSYSDEKYYYTGKDYGNEYMYNPLYVILNGSYDIIQLDCNSRKIFEQPYGSGNYNVTRNIFNPFVSIKTYGWWNFLSNEIFPLSFKKEGMQWWPNYSLHIVGGGMTFASLEEWYEYNNIPEPYIFAAATTMFYHYWNEVVEMEDYRGLTVDPVSDIWVFDIAGILLFSFDGIKEFFRDELHLRDWSLQPSLTVPSWELQNNGQYFSIKYDLPFYNKMALFGYMGMSGLGGLSYKLNGEDAISLGLGTRPATRYIIDSSATARQYTLNLTWNAGLFYDRNGSLMASIAFSGQEKNLCNINIYPGSIDMGNIKLGFWTVIPRKGDYYFGLSARYIPGIGVVIK
ncbi:MAG: hypothetical protein EPN82_06730 [Bacteroidetes bacterium]|nr:MAG: hypothetical protein EPN82_06730 [Bacteroidota bacterium]